MGLQTVGGAQIRITGEDPVAIQAVHDFLKFQNPRSSNRRPVRGPEIAARFPIRTC